MSDWQHDPSKSRLFWLCADAGMGKSAFASALWQKLHTDEELLGAFFCRFGDYARSDGTKVVQSLAFQIAGALPQCGEGILKGAEDLEELVRGRQCLIAHYQVACCVL